MTEAEKVEVIQSDGEFLRYLAARIFIHASPAMGFDQGDTDRLYVMASTAEKLAERHRPAHTAGDVGLRKAQIKTVAEKFAAFTGAPYEDWRHFTIEAGHILDRLEALSRPEAGGKEAAGEGEGRISAVREKLRLRMLEQPISEERNTYSDGYAGGLMDAIGMLDEALQSLPARPGVTREDIAKLRENIPMPGSYDQMRGTYAQGYAQCLDAIMALIQGEAS